jgi:HEAT repeat protein
MRLLLVAGCALIAGLLLWWSFRPHNFQTGFIRALAAQAAAGDPKAASSLKEFGTNAVPSLVELLQYREPVLRRQAYALAPKMPKRLGRGLVALAGPMGSSSVRAAAAKGLALLGPQAEGAVPALLQALHDPEPYLAMEAATALGRIGKASVPGLTKALADKLPLVRHAAAYALGEIGPAAQATTPELVELLRDPDPSVRSSTAYSLMLIGTPAATALSNVIDHADANARELAVTEFIRLYRALRSMTPPLNKMAHAEEAGSRRQAIAALGAIRASDNTTIDTFILALQDPDIEVRLAAIKALGLVPWRAQAAIGELTKCLRESSVAVRLWAAKTLGGIGPPARPALDELRRCLLDNDPALSSAAREAIQKVEAKP